MPLTAYNLPSYGGFPQTRGINFEGLKNNRHMMGSDVGPCLWKLTYNPHKSLYKLVHNSFPFDYPFDSPFLDTFFACLRILTSLSSLFAQPPPCKSGIIGGKTGPMTGWGGPPKVSRLEAGPCSRVWGLGLRDAK